MAEDLSIKVKVSPDVSNVQGELNKAGKDLHLDIKLFDDANIDEQVKKLYSAVEKAAASSSRKMMGSVDGVIRSMKLYEAALADINTMMKTGEVSQKNYAKALADVAIQQKQTLLLKKSSTLASQANNLFSADSELKQLKEQKKALEEQKKLAKEASEIKVVAPQAQGAVVDFTKYFDKTATANGTATLAKLKGDLEKGLTDISTAVGEKADKIQDAFGALSDNGFYKSFENIDDIVNDFLDSFDLDSKKYDEMEGFTDKLSEFITNIKDTFDVSLDTNNADELNGYLHTVIQNWQGLIKLFSGENGQAAKIEAPKIPVDEIDAQLDAIKGKITARQAEILQKVYGMSVEEARSAGVQVGDSFAEGISESKNKIQSQFSDIAETLDIIKNPKTENGKYNPDKNAIIDTYKALDTELVKARKNVVDMFNGADLSQFDAESQKVISQLLNLVDSVGNAQNSLRELFSKGTVSNDDYTGVFKKNISEIYNAVQRIAELSSRLNLDEIVGASTGTTIFNGAANNAGDKLGQQIQLLVNYQTRLTAEKYATAEAEDSIVQKVQSEIDLVKSLLKARKDLEGEAGSSNDGIESIKDNLAGVDDKLKSLDTKGLKTILDTVKSFVESVVSDTSKVDSVTQKIDEFNRKMTAYEQAVTDYGNAITALNTYFQQNAVILKALSEAANVPTAGTTAKGKKNANTETEQQVAAKVTVLLNKAEGSSQKVVEAVKSASESLSSIAKELTEAATSAEEVKTATQPILDAISAIQSAFTAYTSVIANADETAKQNVAETAPKATTVKVKKDSVKDEDVVSASSALTNIKKVFTKFSKVAESTSELGTATDKLIEAGTKIQKVIRKFNGIDTAAVEKAKENKANGVTAETVAKTQKAPETLTVDTAQRSYRSNVSKAAKLQTFYNESVGGRKYDTTELKEAMNQLTPALNRAAEAKKKFEEDGSSDNLTQYRIAIRDLEDEVDSLSERFQAVRKAINDDTQKFEDRTRALNSRLERAKDKYAAVEDRVATAKSRGYDGQISTDISSKAETAFRNANTLKSSFDLAPTRATADALEAQIKELEIATSNYGEETTRVTNNVNQAYRGVQSGIKSASDTINKLTEQKQKLEFIGGKQEDIENLNTLIDRYGTLLKMLKEVDMDNRDYGQILAIFDEFQKDADGIGATIDSLTSLFAAMNQQVNSSISGIRQFNAELKNDRNLNTYEKSMRNALYTAQRYFNANTKISTNPEVYAQYVDFFDKYGTAIKDKSFSADNASQMTKDLSALKKATQDAGLETDSLNVKLKKLFETNLKTQFASQAINMVRQGLQQVYQNVVDIDTAMTELKKVTDETSSTYDKFLTDAGERAKNVGSTVSNIISATADYARLGYNLDDAKTLADVSAVYYNVGDDLDSFSTATDNIVGTMKAFNLEADDAIGLVDRLNEVSNRYAVSSGDLGDILQRSASAMEAAGNTLDQTIALGTAMNSVLQSADTTGTTLKVLALRLRGASTELESMGEETDGVATSTSKLREQIAALTNIDGTGGFDILTDSGDFKSTYDIIQGIAKVYSSMSDVDQAALLELIAGKNRANGVAALLNQAAQAEDVLKTSMNSSGSAMRENERVLESIEGRLKKFQATFQSLSSDVLSSDIVKRFVDMGTAALNFADGLVKAGDAMPTIITALSGLMSLTGTKAGEDMPSYVVGIAA